ncbi:MAG: hypothetical protein IPH80_25590 [Myxococcales bacterium]|nr:hypothetical protein [Myxococcales bacterium]
MRARWLPLIALAACEPTLELSMIADPLTADSTADLSCVRSVSVWAYGAPDLAGNADFATDCAGIAAPGVRTIADLPVSAGVSLAIPARLTSFYAGGIDGTAGDCSGWPVFGAMTFYQGGDHVQLEARPLLDCADRVAAPPPVKMIDFMTLMRDHTCAAPADATTMRGWLGVLADFGDAIGMAYAGAEFPFTAAGTAAVPTIYRRTVGKACIAVEAYDDTGRYQASCVYPDQPSPCGGGEVIYPFASAAVLDDSTDPTMLDNRGGAVVVLVVDAQRAPIANASVTGVDAARADLVYTRMSGANLTASGATATDASGTFIVYTGAPTTVTITAGTRSRTVVLGALVDFRPVPAVVVL